MAMNTTSTIAKINVSLSIGLVFIFSIGLFTALLTLVFIFWLDSPYLGGLGALFLSILLSALITNIVRKFLTPVINKVTSKGQFVLLFGLVTSILGLVYALYIEAI